jgi:spermidine/putrescine transport system substrate-binding protein
MEEIGYVSVVADSTILAWANDEEIEATSNLSYFFGEGAEAVHANHVFYPDQKVIERCALMHDCGDQTEEMLAMWSRVKGDNLSAGLVWFIVVVIGFIVGFAILRAINNKRQRDMQRKKRNHRK